jgi:hypothetical protein
VHYAPGEDHTPARRVSGSLPGRHRREIGDERPALDAIRREVALHGARVGNGEIGALESHAATGGVSELHRQRFAVAGVSAAAREQVRHAAEPMSAYAFLTGLEVVNPGGAGGVTMSADHDRRGRPQRCDDAVVVNLMHVNDLGRI